MPNNLFTIIFVIFATRFVNFKYFLCYVYWYAVVLLRDICSCRIILVMDGRQSRCYQIEDIVSLYRIYGIYIYLVAYLRPRVSAAVM